MVSIQQTLAITISKGAVSGGHKQIITLFNYKTEERAGDGAAVKTVWLLQRTQVQVTSQGR